METEPGANERLPEQKDTEQEIRRAASLLREAKALIVTAGAGMGVDSGLPDFRGQTGFWKAYPPLRDLGISLASMSNPRWFQEDPEFAWGFYGHRYMLYNNSSPHEGFQILRRWGEQMELGYFVYTSNVDGHFQKAGFDAHRIVECHGSIHFLQCQDPDISQEIWPVPANTHYDVDVTSLRLHSPMPRGPPGKDLQVARPNICMFGDYKWIADKADAQKRALYAFTEGVRSVDGEPFVVVEIGSGLAVPTVRYMSESLVTGNRGILIRINPVDSVIPEGIKEHVSIPLGGLEALQRIDQVLKQLPPL